MIAFSGRISHPNTRKYRLMKDHAEWLNAFTGGFRLYVYDPNLKPISSSFDFIVGELV